MKQFKFSDLRDNLKSRFTWSPRLEFPDWRWAKNFDWISQTHYEVSSGSGTQHASQTPFISWSLPRGQKFRKVPFFSFLPSLSPRPLAKRLGGQLCMHPQPTHNTHKPTITNSLCSPPRKVYFSGQKSSGPQSLCLS